MGSKLLINRTGRTLAAQDAVNKVVAGDNPFTSTVFFWKNTSRSSSSCSEASGRELQSPQPCFSEQHNYSKLREAKRLGHQPPSSRDKLEHGGRSSTQTLASNHRDCLQTRCSSSSLKTPSPLSSQAWKMPAVQHRAGFAHRLLCQMCGEGASKPVRGAQEKSETSRSSRCDHSGKHHQGLQHLPRGASKRKVGTPTQRLYTVYYILVPVHAKHRQHTCTCKFCC